MLKEILKALRGADALTEMIGRVGQMLDAGKWMFEQATCALLREVEWGDMAEPLYARDREINEIEQKVRQRIIMHLSLGQVADLSACLVLMSVVKDAERIGDYGKNLFEIARFYRREFTRPEYAEQLEDIRRQVLPLFDSAKEAFVKPDRGVANIVLDKAGKARGRCDVIIRQLLSVHESIAPDEAVAYVLLGRFYKRVAAHLANIATSVVSPVPMIDYRGEMSKAEA